MGGGEVPVAKCCGGCVVIGVVECHRIVDVVGWLCMVCRAVS